MMSMSDTLHRSEARSATITFRVTAEERAFLKKRAADLGMSMQVYLEQVALGREPGAERRPGPPRRQEEELPVAI